MPGRSAFNGSDDVGAVPALAHVMRMQSTGGTKAERSRSTLELLGGPGTQGCARMQARAAVAMAAYAMRRRRARPWMESTATRAESEGKTEGKRSGAYSEPAGVLSVLGEGSAWPESSTKLFGADEEDGVVYLIAGAPGSNEWHAGDADESTAEQMDNGGAGSKGATVATPNDEAMAMDGARQFSQQIEKEASEGRGRSSGLGFAMRGSLAFDLVSLAATHSVAMLDTEADPSCARATSSASTRWRGAGGR